MANIPIYAGSSSFFSGLTPFGFYDQDYQFQQDADKVVKFVAQRLGYPIVEVELQDINFYTAFEEAITTYGNELYAFKVKQDYLSLEGASTGSNLNHTLITPNFAGIVRLSHQYGEEAGVGGKTTWYRGGLPLTSSVQDYDLSAWATANNITGGIEIKKVFYESPPAIVKYFDPYAGTGMGMMNLMDNFGWGNYSPAVNFLMMPVNYDIQKLQAIEFNDQIRKSQYSFELINNRLRIFPIPSATSISGSFTSSFAGLLYFQYVKLSERNDPSAGTDGSAMVTNVSNVPFTNPVYSQINSIGRQWIFKYTLALCKEMLGYVRGKYSNIPIPNSEVTLNQSDLISAATSEKTSLITELRTYFDDTSRSKLLEAKASEADNATKTLQSVPLTIFVG